ncbi:carbon-nitrogen family hydrolase [Planoprotostelium fungivorum]|uniref:Carbon-nitrogen family hydrolase n=1 Tax=Planoprotostelium fungivorum TaxID=1890364 RepID=A0A2P6NX84_9EUKA|nr:carbon-nitrogen family hydrolase [Planoprotostelium fungivorum]
MHDFFKLVRYKKTRHPQQCTDTSFMMVSTVTRSSSCSILRRCSGSPLDHDGSRLANLTNFQCTITTVADRAKDPSPSPRPARVQGNRIGMIEERLLVGCFQNECKDYSFYDDTVKSDNIQILEGVVHDFHQQGVEIAVFSELFLCGYHIGVENIRKMAETSDGPSFQRIAEIARQHNMFIVYGYAERDPTNDKVYNSAIVVNNRGENVINYRKTHLYHNEMFQFEKEAFTLGDRFEPLFEVKGFKVGVLICWDIEFPEPVRVLRLRGADLIIVPTANNDTLCNNITLPARAYENHIFICYINRAGSENGKVFNGESTIVAPHGQVLVKAPSVSGTSTTDGGGSCIMQGHNARLVAEMVLHREEYKTAKMYNPFFGEDGRRPHLYNELGSNK